MTAKPTTFFHTDQHLCYADVLSPPEVLARIEVIVLRFLKCLTSPSPSIDALSLICRTADNTKLRQGCFGEFDSIFLSFNTFNRSLMRLNMGKAFVRVWKVLEICFKILVEGKQANQREIFYKLLCDSPKYFSCQAHVNCAIQDVVALIQCSRNSLGIMASSRGEVIGRLLIHEPNGNTVNCSLLGPTGHIINGNLNVVKKWVFETDSRYIILVEKDAIFQRLAEDRIFNYIPSILISGKGYPDLASRLIIVIMETCFPHGMIQITGPLAESEEFYEGKPYESTLQCIGFLITHKVLPIKQKIHDYEDLLK